MTFFARRKRLRYDDFEPRRAPHRALAREILVAHLPHLQHRLRATALDNLLDEVLRIERSPEPLVELPRPQQTALLVVRAALVANHAAARYGGLAKQFAAFAQAFGRTDPSQQKQFIEHYLRDTVTNPADLAEDLLAMERHLTFEALRERHLAALLRESITIEFVLWFIAEAIPTIATDTEAAAMLEVTDLAEFALAQLTTSSRWPLRWAAAEAAYGLATLVGARAQRAHLAQVPALIQVTHQREEHPWVQIAALRAVVALAPAQAPQLLDDSLARETGPLDIYRRKRLLRVAAEVLPRDGAIAFVTSRVSAAEPSEHVRMGAADIAGELLRAALTQPQQDALIAYLQRQVTDDPSGKVRARVALAVSLAFCHVTAAAPTAPSQQALAPTPEAAVVPDAGHAAAATDAAPPDAHPEDVRAALAPIVVTATADRNTFTANIACEELTAMADALAAAQPAWLATLSPQWLEALHARLAKPDIAPASAESISACAEHIYFLTHDRTRTLLATLSAAARNAPRDRPCDVALPPELSDVQAPELARVLAEVSRRDWGLSARLRRGTVRLWRGDRFVRRLWRIVAELRSPLPNKRQAFWHTIGRTYPGPLRAHPGLLDEATATTVPGERVTVDSEGSWGRHVPQIDDALELPVWSGEAITVASSYGLATLTPPPTRLRRLRTRLALSLRYKELAAMRLGSLAVYRDRLRRRYIEELRQRYGITVTFAPHDRNGTAPLPADVADLFVAPNEPTPPAPAAPAAPPTREGPTVSAFPPLTCTEADTRTSALVPLALGSAALGHGAHATSGAPLAPLLNTSPLGGIVDFFRTYKPYLSSQTQNSQLSLVVFGAAATAYFFAQAWRKRREIERARAGIPLTIGGWGTRGKSGTERLKAGMFDGLGYEVFVKTTGCEAMFIHSAPMQTPVEIFIYRPYDKATIWEQKAMLELAYRFRAQVMMWECMALNPKYVSLLQHEWMNDDLVTLTNSYPDHEDIQGPAGFNVAQVITEFIPTQSTLVTSEATYLPMFAEVAHKRGTTMHVVGDRDAEFIADDVLALFPYREHPRNIALVTRMAQEFELDPDLARLVMSQYVVPDLGVLKAYPPALVRGRKLTFVCGNSANERTGFIGNWRRMKLDQLDCEAEPHKLVVTVVNNRADRIARSEVFARILVRDVAFDRHVLIGTNLEGLMGFLGTALDTYLAEQNLIENDELVPGAIPPTVANRLRRELGILRIAPPTGEHAVRRLTLYTCAADKSLTLPAREALCTQLDTYFNSTLDGPTDLATVRAAVDQDPALKTMVEAALTDQPGAANTLGIESLEAATLDDALQHFRFEVARMLIRARLWAKAEKLFAAPSAEGRTRYLREFQAAYRTMFMAQVDVIADAGATGDQIIDRCARSVPPGTDVILMGTQNIKGTGLDFVYRWLAMDKVVTCARDLEHERQDRRTNALAELEAFEDYGLVDTGYLRTTLVRTANAARTDDERAARTRIAARAEAIWQKRRAGLGESKKTGLLDKVLAYAEGWLDWADSVRRSRGAQAILHDLVHQRISHGRASIEMRKLVGRVKGGWLVKAVRK